jgi:shikimate kinase
VTSSSARSLTGRRIEPASRGASGIERVRGVDTSRTFCAMNDVLVLVGMSGVGKSFWAERLTRVGYERHDCDGAIGERLGTLVEAAPNEAVVHALGRWMGMPWSAGYAEREARYLALEAAVTAEALDAASASGGRHVIDTTGSVIYLDGALLARLRGVGRVVYLRTPDARRDAMLKRYLEEPKPVVWGDAFRAHAGERPEDALPRCYAKLLAWRDARYATLAHVTLDGGELEANDPGLDGFLARIA